MIKFFPLAILALLIFKALHFRRHQCEKFQGDYQTLGRNPLILLVLTPLQNLSR